MLIDDWNKYLIKPRGIIFDLDGVIALTEEVHRQAFDMAFAGYDIKKYDWNKDFAGKGHRYIIDTVFGANPANDRLIDKWVHYYQLIAANKVVSVPGVIEFIKRQIVPMIIATGSVRKSAEVVLKNLNISLLLVSMEDAPAPKPNPGIFLLAAEKINVEPKDCLVFEDSIYGIKAGKNAGMTVIALTTTHDKSVLIKEMPDLIIQDFREIKYRVF